MKDGSDVFYNSCFNFSSVLAFFGLRKTDTEDGSSEVHSSSSIGISSMYTLGCTSQALPSVNRALLFTMDELQKATSNFSAACKIGQGGFGIVYKGEFDNGMVVAVKRARKDAFEACLATEFHGEVKMLAGVEHLNLVKLIGYYEGENERILVQEYVPNGNLRQHLDCEFGVVLSMLVRLDIAIDVAHALTYLHLYAERPIIHRDVKASNILLTRNFRAKVCDFGFCRVGPLDSGATHVSTKTIKGTAGYMDPEYLRSFQLSPKSDVYSFGILLLELLTGRRPIDQKQIFSERILRRWAFKMFLDGNLVELLDPNLEKSEAACTVLGRICDLAFKCAAPTKCDRPTMRRAAECLWAMRKDYQALLGGQA